MTDIQVEITNPATAIEVEVISGIPGPPGADGTGIPDGGTTGQVLTKESNADGDADWEDATGGGGAVDSVNGHTGVVVLIPSDIFPDGFDFTGYDGSDPVTLAITRAAGQTAPMLQLLRADATPALKAFIVEGSNPAFPTESGMQMVDVRYGPNPGDGAATFWRQMSRPPTDTSNTYMVQASIGTYADNAGFSSADVQVGGPNARTFPEYEGRAQLTFDGEGARVTVVAANGQTGPVINLYSHDGIQWFYVRPNGRMYDFAPDSVIHETEMPAGGGLTRRWTDSTKRLTLAVKATDGSMRSVDIPTAVSAGGVAGALLLATSADISALSTVYQPLDSDLTAIAALTTTAYGRAFLALADAAAARSALSLGTMATATAADYLPLLAGGAAVENVGAIESNVNTVSATGSTETLDTSVYAVHDTTMDQNCTFTFSNPAPSGKNSTFMHIIRGAFTPTLPASVKWSGGAAPTYTTPSVYVFTTVDAGTNWLGQQVGKAFA